MFLVGTVVNLTIAGLWGLTAGSVLVIEACLLLACLSAWLVVRVVIKS